MRYLYLLFIIFPLCGNTQELRVLTINVLNSLENDNWNDTTWSGDGKSRSQQIASIVKQVDANIVCLQEYLHNDRSLAIELERITSKKWYYKANPRNCAVLSVFPILVHKDIFFQPLQVRDDLVVSVSSGHFHVGEYLPSELRKEGDVAAACRKVFDENHNGYWNHILDEIRVDTKRHQYNSSLLCVGDFNEPSHFDYTKRAYDKGFAEGYDLVGLTSQYMVDTLGFKDAYHEHRKMQNKNECELRGFTYAPTTWYYKKQYADHRIDFIYYRSPHLKLKEAMIVGETPTHTIEGDYVDIQINPWPTDHRATLSVFEIVKQF